MLGSCFAHTERRRQSKIKFQEKVFNKKSLNNLLVSRIELADSSAPPVDYFGTFFNAGREQPPWLNLLEMFVGLLCGKAA